VCLSCQRHTHIRSQLPSGILFTTCYPTVRDRLIAYLCLCSCDRSHLCYVILLPSVAMWLKPRRSRDTSAISSSSSVAKHPGRTGRHRARANGFVLASPRSPKSSSSAQPLARVAPTPDQTTYGSRSQVISRISLCCEDTLGKGSFRTRTQDVRTNGATPLHRQ
jgi:hypothetical protein